MSRIFKAMFTLWFLAVLTGCTSTQSTSQLANPASENCVKQGGTLSIQTRPDGGQYGVCTFEDNRQCEEWALMRGDCPVGGLKITGYVTASAQFCAITGGTYTVTAESNTEQEQGTCTFNNGKTCNADEYYAGTCEANSAVETYSNPFAYCSAVGTIDEPDAQYSGEKVPAEIVQGMVAAGIVTADTPQDIQQNATWRCMDGKVWVCHFGANLPCLERADLSETPSVEMNDYCKANPSTDVIPAAVTGRATIYEWKCADGTPQAVRQVLTSDAQGFIADFWYEIPPQ